MCTCTYIYIFIHPLPSHTFLLLVRLNIVSISMLLHNLCTRMYTHFYICVYTYVYKFLHLWLIHRWMDMYMCIDIRTYECTLFQCIISLFSYDALDVQCPVLCPCPRPTRHFLYRSLSQFLSLALSLSHMLSLSRVLFLPLLRCLSLFLIHTCTHEMTRHDTFFFSLLFCFFVLSFSFMHTSTPSNDTRTMHRRFHACLCRCLLREPHAHMCTYIYLYTYNTPVHVYAHRTGVFSAGQVAVCVCFDHLIRTCICTCVYMTHTNTYMHNTQAFSAVVMSLFASATSIACQRRLPDAFCTPQVKTFPSQLYRHYIW